jgi:hypothetical protein
MTFIPNSDFYTDVAQGKVPKHSIVHKFGYANLTTTLKPITNSGDYPTPTTAVSLEFVSSSANDTSAGTGARAITLVGLDNGGVEITQVISTNGTTAVAIPTALRRLFKWYVSSSGTYATSTTGSHAGTLTIRVAGGGATWFSTPITPYPLGRSQISCYTIPIGHTGYILRKVINVDSAKTADIYMFKRENILDVTTPFEPMTIFEREIGVALSNVIEFTSPKLIGTGGTDIIFMGKVSTGTAECSLEFELLLIED